MCIRGSHGRRSMGSHAEQGCCHTCSIYMNWLPTGLRTRKCRFKEEGQCFWRYIGFIIYVPTQSLYILARWCCPCMLAFYSMWTHIEQMTSSSIVEMGFDAYLELRMTLQLSNRILIILPHVSSLFVMMSSSVLKIFSTEEIVCFLEAKWSNMTWVRIVAWVTLRMVNNSTLKYGFKKYLKSDMWKWKW